MFKILGNLVVKYRISIVIFWVIAAVAMFLFAPSLSETGKMDTSTFLPANSESLNASELISEYFPDTATGGSGTLVFYRDTGLTEADRTYGKQVQEWLLNGQTEVRVMSVTSIFNTPELSSRLVSPDNTTMLMNIGLSATSFESESAKGVETIRQYLKGSPDGLQVYVSGSAGIYADLSESLTKSVDVTTWITVILVIVLLLIIYRSPIASLVPLFTIGLAYLVCRGVMGLAAQAGLAIWSNIDVFLIVLVFGAGTDYCLFMMSRFREELKKNENRVQATKSTVTRISSVITASGFAVILGLSGMIVARYQMIKTMGPILGLTIFITLLAALTLTPALASLFGRKLFWPAHAEVRNGAKKTGAGFWARVAHITTGHPYVVVPLVIIVMAVPLLALPGLNQSYDEMAELPSGSDSTTGFRVLEKHFNVGEMDPITTIVVAPEGDNMTGPTGLAALVELGNDIRGTKGVAQVQTLVQPYGTSEIPAGFTVSGQLTTMVASLSGETGGSQTSVNMTALASGVSSIGTYLTELGNSFTWVKTNTDYQGMTDAVAGISTQLQALQSGVLQPAELAQAAADIQQQLAALGRHGTALADKFKAAGDPCFLPSSLISDAQTAKTIQLFISENGRASRFYVILDTSPQSNAALSTIKDIRSSIKSSLSSLSPGFQVAVGGSTATLADVRTTLNSDFTKVEIVVLGGVFIVFVLLLRSLVAPVYLLLTVLLSYGTTLGLTSWIFQSLLGQDGISFIVPIMVFVLLVALGADYNIFLMSRVREESESKPTREATRIAAGATGSVITACGIILAGTFAALIVSPLRMMAQVGTAVAIGIIIDTFIVRSLLVPAIATLVGRWNWWPSRFGKNVKKGPD
jgi:RND superfamily putative drug exporter